MSIQKYSRFYEKGTLIFEENSLGSEMYIVKEGLVKIEIDVKTENGSSKKHIGNIESGSFFGEMALIGNFPRTASATAAEDTTLIFLNKNRFYRLIEHSPEFAIKIVRKISERLKESNHRLQQFLDIHKKTSIIQILKKIAEDISLNFDLRNCFEKNYFESYTYEEVLVAVHQMEVLGILTLDKKQNISIKDITSLNKISQFLQLINYEELQI